MILLETLFLSESELSWQRDKRDNYCLLLPSCTNSCLSVLVFVCVLVPCQSAAHRSRGTSSCGVSCCSSGWTWCCRPHTWRASFQCVWPCEPAGHSSDWRPCRTDCTWRDAHLHGKTKNTYPQILYLSKRCCIAHLYALQCCCQNCHPQYCTCHYDVNYLKQGCCSIYTFHDPKKMCCAADIHSTKQIQELIEQLYQMKSV